MAEENIEGTLIEKIEKSKAIIKEAIEKYPNISIACSFGKDSMVVLHLALEIDPNIPVFAILTPMKPKATFQYKDVMERLWKLNLKIYMSDEKPIEGLWKTDPDKCCEIFKVVPTKEAIKDLDAWVTGLRRTEGETRTDYQPVETSDKTNVVKINPILDWTEVDIWRYLAINAIPVNPFYKKGYRSLGCEPCTALVKDKDPERYGRWVGTCKLGGECGIHTMHK